MTPIHQLIYTSKYGRVSLFDHRDSRILDCGRLWWDITVEGNDYREAVRGTQRIRWYYGVVSDSDYGPRQREVKYTFGLDFTDVSNAILAFPDGRYPAEMLGTWRSEDWSEVFRRVDEKRPLPPPPLADGQMWALVALQTVWPPRRLTDISGLHTEYDPRRPRWEFAGDRYTDEEMKMLLHQGIPRDFNTPLVTPQLIHDPLNPNVIWSR